MKIDLTVKPDSIFELSKVLSDICNSQPITTEQKVNKCILIDVFKTVDNKAKDLRIKQTALFDNKKQIKLSFKISQAYYLYNFLSDIELFNDGYTKLHIQKIINILHQKLC